MWGSEMADSIASCSVPVERSHSEISNHTSEQDRIKRRRRHHGGIAPSAVSSTKGKERQSPLYPYPSTSTFATIDRTQDSLALLMRAAGIKVTNSSEQMHRPTSERRSLPHSKKRPKYGPDADICEQCVIPPVCSLGDPNIGEDCCTAPCPVTCPAGANSSSPESDTLLCSASAVACCEDALRLVDIKPILTVCQGLECAEEAVVVCDDGACVAPLEEECPSACAIGVKSNTTDNSPQDACPACDDGASKTYSSFQELLDCWCCADSEMAPCNSSDGSACPDLSLSYDACCIERPFAAPSILPQSTSAARSASSSAQSRDTSTSNSTLQSPSLSSHEGINISSRYWSNQEVDRVRENSQLEDQYMKCLFEGNHRHNDQGMCLPPSMTLRGQRGNSSSHPQRYTSPAPPAPVLHICHWAGCGLQCASVTELASHVNTIHLAAAAPSTNTELVSKESSSILWGQQDHALKCLWDSCQMQENIPDAIWQDENLILEHILQAHVGVDDFSSLSSSNASKRNYGAEHDHMPSRAREGSSIEDIAEDEHVCKWNGCSAVFTNHEDLTTHITSLHVGSGRAQYTCEWDGCTRGDRTFFQKQKILRHLQTHTGYRPHICDICEKRFSEPSTLAQHKRTHTKEKPYSCDYPNCGKSFAVAASLTIHKRIHTGEKPFKCTWKDCNIAFSESSNLRKHMRIHTGERPFACTQDGCNKTFSRPDQLARHRKTHTKDSDV